MIYMDAAATTAIKPRAVAEAVYKSLTELTGNAARGSGYYSLKAARSLYGCRSSLAKLFSLEDPLNIAFTPNVTLALNYSIESLAHNCHIITSCLEHNSVLRPLYAARERGCSLSFLPINNKGVVEVENLEKLLEKNTKLVVLTRASNVTGQVLNINKVLEFCKEKGLILIVDGAQSAGIVPEKFSEDMGSFAYCFTGHKGLYGPQGTGGIVSSNIEYKQVFSGGDGSQSFSKYQPKTFPEIFEIGTTNTHSLLGLKAGVEYLISEDVEKSYNRLKNLREKFIKNLMEMENIVIYSQLLNDAVPVVSLNLKNRPSSYLSSILEEDYSIVTRSGFHCAPLVHKHFGTEKQGMVRFSFSTFTKEEEVEEALRALEEINMKRA